jgi:hypothetical protein
MRKLFQPADFTVSWVRAYSCLEDPRRILDLKDDPDAARAFFGPGLERIDEGDPEFWDVQTSRRSHVARVTLGGLRARLTEASSDWWPVHVHLLFHVSGFMVMRFTVQRADVASHGLDDITQWHRLAALPWGPEAIEWEGTFHHSLERHAGVREVMDLLFYDMHERSKSRAPRADVFASEWTYEDRYAWYEGRLKACEIRTGYPVTFGTSFETLWHGDRPPEEVLERAAGLSTFSGSANGSDVAADCDDHWWFFGENTAVLALMAATTVPDRERMHAIDPIRSQIVEYMTLQRAALRSVQRATQLAISEGEHIGRKQVAQWGRLVASLSDDYVLHDQVAARLEPLRLHLKRNPTLRDPEQLAQQVRSNLASFESLIASANNRAGLVLSGLFGLIAASAIDPVVHEVAYEIDGGRGGVDAFAASHPGLMTGLDIGSLITLAAFAVACYAIFVSRVRTAR